MPRKKTDDSDNSSNTTTPTTPAQTQQKTNPLIYVGVLVVIVIVGLIAYYALSGLGGQSVSSKDVFNNVLNSSLNQTQTQFVKDLQKSENISSLAVVYYSSNVTQYVTQSANLTISITNNQTINSYKLGNYNKSVLSDVISYTNTQNGDVILKNVSQLYYYNTNTTVTCYNDTTYSSGLITNSSLQCANGDQGQSYLEETPFTAANVSLLSYLVFNNSVTYSGTKSFAGRSCDNFIISNGTSTNLQSNYSVFDICVDTQYGVPLYFNETDIIGGVPSSETFMATMVSSNVPSSEFVIPQAYLNSIQSGI